MQLLSSHLQQTLNSELPHGPAFRVQCLLKQEMLMVLAQHTPKVQPDAQRVFQLLEEDIDHYRPRISDKGRLFLRIAGEKNPYLSHPFAISQYPALEPEPAPSPAPTQHASASFSLGCAVGGLLVLMVAGIAVYILSRPCMIGSCIPLEMAQRLQQVAVQTAETTDNPQKLLEAHKQLQEAISQAEAIPFWSSYFPPAQEFLRAQEQPVQNLNRMVTALSQGNQAAQLSLNPPHPLETWQEVERLWQQAVANLEQVSGGGSIYPVLDVKLQEYRQNLQAIQTRIKIEQQANRNLEVAKSHADLAKTRQGIAQSLENWQQVHYTWSMAVNGLKNIPQGTQAHQQANQLLDVYQTQFQASRERLVKEEIASQTYNEALSLADKAKSLERENEFTLAVGHWSQALNYLQQVPRDSFYYAQAAPLVGSYQSALDLAGQKLRQQNILQQARNDLNQTCAGLPKICDYTVTESLLKVTLTRDYVRTVRTTLMEARGQADLTMFTSVDEHVQSVQNALENISRTAKIPLELYDPEGKIMGTYVP